MNNPNNVWINRKFFFFLAFCFLALIVSTGYLSYVHFFASSPKASVQGAKIGGMKDISALNEEQILQTVGKMLLLPSETPTFASVSDTQKLRGKELFTNAEKGDIVMIFQKAQKVVIFRPKTSQIVEVAKIDLQTALPALPTAAPSLTPTPTIVIYNVSPIPSRAASSSSGLQ